MTKKHFFQAFKTSIPVLFGYLAIGIAFFVADDFNAYDVIAVTTKHMAYCVISHEYEKSAVVGAAKILVDVVLAVQLSQLVSSLRLMVIVLV